MNTLEAIEVLPGAPGTTVNTVIRGTTERREVIMTLDQLVQSPDDSNMYTITFLGCISDIIDAYNLLGSWKEAYPQYTFHLRFNDCDLYSHQTFDEMWKLVSTLSIDDFIKELRRNRQTQLGDVHQLMSGNDPATYIAKLETLRKK